MTHIETRLAKLEKKLRIYQLTFFAVIMIIGFFILTSFNKTPVVYDLLQAREFQVVDAGNNVLISLKKDTTGGGHVNIYDKSGNNVLYMHSGYRGGRIVLTDFSGKSGMVAAVTEEGHGVLNVYNKTDQRICAVGGDANGNGVLNIYNSAGEKMNGIWPKE